MVHADVRTEEEGHGEVRSQEGSVKAKTVASRTIVARVSAFSGQKQRLAIENLRQSLTPLPAAAQCIRLRV